MTDNARNPELRRHYFIFDRPHIYRCGCGAQISVFVVEGVLREEVENLPSSPELMECGHAVCARKQDGACIVCLNTGHKFGEETNESP